MIMTTNDLSDLPIGTIIADYRGRKFMRCSHPTDPDPLIIGLSSDYKGRCVHPSWADLPAVVVTKVTLGEA